jgi:putative transposase
MSRFRKLSQTLWHCQYHIVWCPKYRFRVFEGEIKEEAEECTATPGRSQLTDEKLILMPTKSGKTKKQPRLSRNYPEIDCHWRTNPFSGHICPIVLT